MAETKLSDDLLEEIWAYIADGTRWVRKSVLESWHTRVSQLEQTIDGLCAANEQANALLGEEIERRELAEARLAALTGMVSDAVEQMAPDDVNFCTHCKAKRGRCDIDCDSALEEWAKREADALRKDGEQG